MSSIFIVAIVFGTFLILAIVLYALTKSNIWNPSTLEPDEHIGYTEDNVSLNMKQNNYLVQGLRVVITNKRIFLLRGKYKYITLYLDETQTSDKIKKMVSSSRYHLFLVKDESSLKNDADKYIFSFTGKTFMGQKAQYKLFLKQSSIIKKLLNF